LPGDLARDGMLAQGADSSVDDCSQAGAGASTPGWVITLRPGCDC
jgi:hypothetical protein